MATKKDKLLESAQKSLKKKQVLKAIKDYVKIIELDPADVRSRQKLAELYVRTGKNAEAYEQYEAVAKYFSSNGFYPKAIAIYKQMQRLDPYQVSLFYRLAELNEKQGLIGNALAEYRTLVDHYERNGMLADVIKVLEKMRDLDQENLNIRVKLAEIYVKNDHKDEALAELDGAFEALSAKGAYDKILRLYKMFLPFFPNNQKMQMGLVLAFYEKNDFQRGVKIVENLLKDKSRDPDLLRLAVRGYSGDNDWHNVKKTNRLLLDMDPTDLVVRDGLIRSEIETGAYTTALQELEVWKEAFFQAQRLDLLKEYYERLKIHLPGNSKVLETLDSIYELTGEGDKLLDILAERDDEKENSTAADTISDLLLGSAVDDIESETVEQTAPAGIADSDEDPLDDESFDLLPAETDDREPDSLIADDELIELEIDDDFTSFQQADSSPDVAEKPVDPAASSPDEFIDFSFELPDDDTDLAPAPDLQEKLEEAEFFFAQGFYSEAEKIYHQILAQAPDMPDCLRRLDEIAGLGTSDPVADQHDLTTDDLIDDLIDAELDFDLVADSPKESAQEKKAFKTDVDEQIAADDLESHYNLGIAYRDMGLFDDAISEFEKAQNNDARYIDCLTLKGLCYADKNDFSAAESLFQLALESPFLEQREKINLNYELGLLYEKAERSADALARYELVLHQDSQYRDISDKIARLKNRSGDKDKGFLEEDGNPDFFSF